MTLRSGVIPHRSPAKSEPFASGSTMSVIITVNVSEASSNRRRASVALVAATTVYPARFRTSAVTLRTKA